MVRQTPMNRGPVPPVRHSLSGLAHDAITLAELQCQLLAVDARDARRGGTKALVALGVGAILGLACLPVLLIAGAHALIELLAWPGWVAYAAVGTAALTVAAILGWTGSRKLLRSLQTVGRSREEFLTTLRWFKQSLRPSENSRFEFEEWQEPDAIRPQQRSF